MDRSIFRPQAAPGLRQWFRRAAGRPRRPYTAAEVLAQLSPASTAAGDPARARAIQACAARPSEWLDRLDARTRWQLGRLAERLPAIVSWYARGLSLDEIGARTCLFAGELQARRALAAAARCIAARLNDPTLSAVPGAG